MSLHYLFPLTLDLYLCKQFVFEKFWKHLIGNMYVNLTQVWGSSICCVFRKITYINELKLICINTAVYPLLLYSI